MDTNRIKKFAIEARNTLKAGIAGRLAMLGFKKDGTIADNMRPILLQGGSVWNGATETEGFYHRWMSLYERVQRKGLNEVYEEAAYTWFNRLVAIRILQKNGLAAPILDFVDIARTPRIVDDARSGQFPQMSAEDRDHLNDLLDDDSKTTEQFAILLTSWCHNNPIINSCFGGIKDYTEILLPNDILKENGFVDMLNHTEFITDEEFTSPELIGWLYQFYISERKDEVYAKNGKFEADEIPAATQIFTPNWIVKYMVQNTVGRIYLDNNPSAASLKANWKYLVEGEPTPQESIYRYNELTDLKVGDLACGSGHILNECFDLLYELYINEAYTRKEAIENIFKHNLTGVDLDKRAQQLSKFALLLKACQKDSSFADAHCMPHVLTMPKPWNEQASGTVEAFLHHFFKGSETKKMVEELTSAYNLMQDADSLGSIMKFDISDSTRKALVEAVSYWREEQITPKDIESQLPAIKLILALTENYTALSMNPPYMGGSNMNNILSRYVKNNYSSTKTDLFAVFMEVGLNRLAAKGKLGMINMQNWMFLSSFVEIRENILSNYSIDSLIHLGPRFFDANSVGTIVQTVAFVISKTSAIKNGYYYRIVDGKNSCEKESLFLNEKPFIINQRRFFSLTGSPMTYWISDKIVGLFKDNPLVTEFGSPRQGLATCDNKRFLRLWYEVDTNKVNLCAQNAVEAKESRAKWFPYNKGGTFRKWYGNNEWLINWENDGEEIVDYVVSLYGCASRTIKNTAFYFREAITWTDITFVPGFRYQPAGFIFDVAGMSYFMDKYNASYLGIFNTKVYPILGKAINPSLHLQAGNLATLPMCKVNDECFSLLTNDNVNIAKQDWDAHETSWDFKQNELISLHKEGLGKVSCKIEDTPVTKYSDLELLYNEYVAKWKSNFLQMHANEEELNRQFIEIYGLQDELTPDVPFEEITILQEGEKKIENGEINFKPDVIMKQLLSYAIGCWMGRYRLDKEGLHIAHPNPSKEEVCTYEYNGEPFTIDDDGNIPLLPYDCPFDDNLQNRIADFVKIAFGRDSITTNLNFIEKSLGCSIEKYLDKDFWKDHKKMYQNKPIYWLWSSKKGAFRVLSYMHRMDAYTAERIRSKYLLPYIEYVQNKIHNLENKITSLTTTEKRSLDNYRKILEECREYHDRLHVVAEQAIAFDLDDGVTVNYAKFGDVLSKIK